MGTRQRRNGGPNLISKEDHLPSPAFSSFFRASEKEKPKNGRGQSLVILVKKKDG